MGEVADAVKKAGLKIRNVYDAFSHNAPDDNSERLYYIIENSCVPLCTHISNKVLYNKSNNELCNTQIVNRALKYAQERGML